MRLSDLIDPKNGPTALVKFAVVPLILVVTSQAIAVLVSQLSAIDILLALLFLTVLSPLAYFIRESRQGHSRHESGRRGAERTPLLPPNEEDQ
jgi:hypothetical protein